MCVSNTNCLSELSNVFKKNITQVPYIDIDGQHYTLEVNNIYTEFFNSFSIYTSSLCKLYFILTYALHVTYQNTQNNF